MHIYVHIYIYTHIYIYRQVLLSVNTDCKNCKTFTVSKNSKIHRSHSKKILTSLKRVLRKKLYLKKAIAEQNLSILYEIYFIEV